MTMGTAFKRGPDYGALGDIVAGLRDSIIAEVKAAVLDLYQPPNITVTPAPVTVEPPDVTVTPTINVPPQDLNVNVTIPGIDALTVEIRTLCVLLQRPVRTTIERGAGGLIASTTQTR